MSRRVAGAAEKRGIQIGILKGFLMFAEAKGWVSRSGGCKWLYRRRAQFFWVGVQTALKANPLDCSFDDGFLQAVKYGDPINHARDLCALHSMGGGS